MKEKVIVITTDNKISIKELDAEIRRHWAELFHDESVEIEKAASNDD